MKETIAILGLGKLGSAICQGLTRNKDYSWSIVGSCLSERTASERSKQLKIECFTDNKKVVSRATIVLAVVPAGDTLRVLDELKDELVGKVVISVAAGISIPDMRRVLRPSTKIVRAMANTLSETGDGLTVVCGDAVDSLQPIMEALGHVVEMPERLFDEAMTISACGPALVYYFMESMVESGVHSGLLRNQCQNMVAMVFQGAAQKLLKVDGHPTLLKEEVTTSGGVTIEALRHLERSGMKGEIMDSLNSVLKRLRD